MPKATNPNSIAGRAAGQLDEELGWTVIDLAAVRERRLAGEQIHSRDRDPSGLKGGS